MILVSYALFCIITFPCIPVKIIRYSFSEQFLSHSDHLPFFDLAKQEAHTLVVSRIEPEHTSKDFLCLFVAGQGATDRGRSHAYIEGMVGCLCVPRAARR